MVRVLTHQFESLTPFLSNPKRFPLYMAEILEGWLSWLNMPWPKGLVNDVWRKHIFTFTHLKLAALIWQFISNSYLPFSEGGSNPYITYYIFLNRSLWSTKSVWQHWIVWGRWYMFQYEYVSNARYTYLTYIINISSSAALLPYHNMYLKDTWVNVFLHFWGNCCWKYFYHVCSWNPSYLLHSKYWLIDWFLLTFCILQWRR